MLPSVSITKVDFATGSVAPSPVGVLAIIAPASSGPQNVATSYTQDTQAWNDFGPSSLVGLASYVMQESGNPVVVIRPLTSTAATYGTIDVTGMTGTSVPTAGAAVPADNYDVIVTVVAGGTIGAAGLTYTYSLDGGNSTSGVQALPTGGAPITLTLPNFTRGGSPGVSFSLAAGTWIAGDFFRVLTLHAQQTSADLTTALEALRVTTIPWEAVLIDQDAATGAAALLDTWLAGLEKVGKFKMAFLNTRLKNQPHVPGTSGAVETETAYATAMGTLAAGSAPSIRVAFSTDGGEIQSTLTGLSMTRPSSLFVAARSMGIAIGIEPAYVALGPLGGVTITDDIGNPAYHNEEIYQNLDQLQLTTLRSVNGQSGAYVTNGRIFSTVGSDYVLIPHVRTMNRSCEIAYQILTKSLSKGIGKKQKDPVTGLVYILEADALAIEGQVNAAVRPQLQNQVQQYAFTLSRTDDLSANSGAILNGSSAIVALAYIKGFKVLASFAKSIAVGA